MTDFEFKDIKMSYGNNLVLDGVCGSFPAGTIIGLMGLNGAGKTTLFRCLTGFLPCEGSTNKTKNSDIAYMSVDNLLYNDYNLKDALEFYNDFMPNFDYEGAKVRFTKMNFDMKKRLNRFSSGQKRIINFILTMHCEARVYLFDEPLSNLDALYRTLVTDLLITRIDDNKIFVVSTHELVELEDVLSHIVILKDRKLSSLYDCEELRKNEGGINRFYKEQVLC